MSKPESMETLDARGSRMATARRRRAREHEQDKRLADQRAGMLRIAVPDLPDSPAFLALMRTGVPGYDPWADAAGCRFDEDAARAAILFFHKHLCHVKGADAGKPFILEPWQQAIIGNLFGWKRADGSRRYRKCLLFVPRKNGKTALAAGVVLYVLTQDNEPGSEIYGAAFEYKQATLVFQHARGMVYRMGKRVAPKTFEFAGVTIKVYDGTTKSMQLEHDASTYLCIPNTDLASHGFNVHCAVVDELHTQQDSDLIDALDTGTGARRQPLLLYLTTSDYERPGSPCNEMHEYAGKIRDGIISDPTFLPVIYEATVEDDWQSPEVWAKANPNMGVTFNEHYISQQCQKAIETPRFENVFKRLHLNIRTEQAIRFLPMTDWDACGAEPVFDADREWYGALDLASTRDTCSFVLVSQGADGYYDVVPWFWVPKDTARERSKADHTNYELWIKQGLMTATAGNVTDYEQILFDINALRERFDIRQIALDPWNAQNIENRLLAADADVVKFRQGYASMTSPMKAFERAVMGRRLRHGGHPVLRWMASNLMAEMDPAGNVKPSKAKSGDKIDGIVSLIMCLGCIMVAAEEEHSSFEDENRTVFM